MSHLSAGLISAYNSLTDRHLAGYFSNTRIRRHLQRAGLITRSGRIVPDKEYRHALIQRAHQRHVRECLAQAIFHKVLEMERVHQIEIKRKLEEFARRERVHKIKVERPKRYEEDIVRILSPRPPAGAKCGPKQHSGPEGEHSESSESPGSSRPNTAPGKMQRPVRLKPIRSSGRLLQSSNESDRPLHCTVDKAPRRRVTTAEVSHGISPYCLPAINNFVTPVPPATRRKERAGAKVTASGALRGRRLRPTTASSGPDVTEDPPVLRSSVHQSKVCVNMIYFGKTVHLSHDLTDARDEVKVFQQHCGGENLCVFRGRLREGETFQFISRRHRGFPFSLTFFLSGLQVERLSSCCEFKHRKGPRLGGRHGHFGFCGVEGASPCYKCIIAMGLDKKPTPPPRRVKEDTRGAEESASSLGDAPRTETERTADAETRAGEGTDAGGDKVGEDYEEDFEADGEGPPGDVEADGKKSSSPADEGDASETEDDERDEDTKSNSGSSTSQSDAEATKDSGEDERAEEPGEADREEVAAPPGGMEDGPKGHGAAAALEDGGGGGAGGEAYDAGSEDPSGDGQVEETVEEDKGEERERAKSVQEKLAEAILKESQCSSEPELSDTSTEEEEEEEEESTDKGPEKDSQDAFAVKSVTLSEQQPALEEETACEDGVVGENQETSEPKDHENETEQEPQGISEVTRDEKVKGEKDKTPAENTKPEHTEYTALHPISEEAISEDHQAYAPQGDAAARGEPAENNEGNEGNEETGRATKSGEADESSVSEPGVITEVTDDAEAGATAASETMEMKAEPSEEREALSCEEAPVAGAEESQRGGGGDRDAASEAAVAAEISSGDAAVDEAAAEAASEDHAEDESTDDDAKEGEASPAAGRRDVNEQRGGDLGEELTERNSGDDDEPEEEREKGGKPKNPVEKTEGGNGEESDEDENEMEEEEKDENKTEEKISEWAKRDSNAEGNADEEQAEGDRSEEEEAKAANEEEAEESERPERDEGGENKKDEEEMGDATDETNECERITADGGKVGEAEKEEKAENKDHEESEEKKVVTDEPAEGEEISEIPEESEKNADLDEDNVKISDEHIAESEDAPDEEQAQNDAEEAEDVIKETEGGSDHSEKAQRDVENGEMSARAEDSAHEGEAQTEAQGDEDTSDGRRTEEPTAAPEDSGGGPEEGEGDNVRVDVGRSEAEEEKAGVEKREESTENDSESKSHEQKDGGTKPEESVSVPGNQVGDSDLMESSDDQQQRNAGEVTVASSAGQVQPPPDAAVDPDDSPHESDESTAPSDARTDGHPPPDEDNAAGDNGADTEEASKASEEGASVLLRPPAEEEKEESEVAGSGAAPQAPARGDNADLVTDWVTMHQASRCFETFVEPLEDLNGSGPLQVEGAPEGARQDGVNETREKSEGDTVASNVESDHSEEGDGRRVDGEAAAEDLTPKTESERRGTKSASAQDVRSEGHEAGSRDRTEEATGDDGPGKATPVGEEKDLPPSPGSGEPTGPREARADESEGTPGESGEQRREVTALTPPESDEGGRSPLVQDIRRTLPVKT
ncbi:erich3 [Pungitius sinensis]